MATYDLSYPGAAIDSILNTAYYLQQAGYIFRGSASDYGGTPAAREWVIAPAGFSGLGLSSAVPKGSIGVCLYNGSSWTGKVINVVTVDSNPAAGSDNAVSSGGTFLALATISSNILGAVTSLSLSDGTATADQGTKLTLKLSDTYDSVTSVLSSLDLLAATTTKAGLLSAADKVKLDSFLTEIRSMTFADTTASADQATKIVESLKWTVGGVQEVIDSLTILAATTSKAGLLSASDKAYIDALPSALTSLSNSISGALALMQSMVGYYVCDTAAGTAAKTVDATGYSLTNGGCIRIKMTNANTAANVTLNINSTGAKALYYDGAQASSTNTWEAGEVLEVYYDGTQYQCASGGGGKFATGEKVKDTSISDEVKNNGDLVTGKAVFPTVAKIEAAEGNTAEMDIETTWGKGTTNNSTGALVNDNNTIRTDYIDIANMVSFTFGVENLPTGYTYQIKPTWYNASKGLLVTPAWSDKVATELEYDKPVNAAYVIFVLAAFNGNTQVSLSADNVYGAYIKTPYTSAWDNLLQKVALNTERTKEIETIADKISEAEGERRMAPLLSSDLEQGTTNNSTGADASAGNCVRTGYIHREGIESVIVSPTNIPAGKTIQAKISWYNENKVYIVSTSWSASSRSEVTFPIEGYYMRLVISSSASTFTPADAEDYEIYTNLTDTEWYNLLERVKTLENSGIQTVSQKIAAAEETVKTVALSDLFQGTTNSSTGAIVDSSYGVGVNFIYVKNYKYINIGYSSLPNGYKTSIKLQWYGDNYATIGYTDWDAYNVSHRLAVNSNASYVRVVMGVHNASGTAITITPNDVYGYGVEIKLEDDRWDGLIPLVYEIKSEVEGGNTSEPLLQQQLYVNDTTKTWNLLHFSDIHGDDIAANMIMGVYNKLTSEIVDDILDTGDDYATTWSGSIAFIESSGLGIALRTIGNHDTNTMGTTPAETSLAVYNKLIAPFVSQWGVTQPANAATEGLNYWYKDYATEKIRLIGLDCMYQTEAQLQWFQQVLADTLTSGNSAYGYSVVIASHYIPGSATLDDIIKDVDGRISNFTGYGTTSVSDAGGWNFQSGYPEAVQSFVNNGGKFVVWLCGHRHQDAFFRPTTYPSILVVDIDKAGKTGGSAPLADRTGECRFCTNLVSVDATNKLLKIKRYGVTADKYLRTITAFCYDYNNNVLISSF